MAARQPNIGAGGRLHALAVAALLAGCAGLQPPIDVPEPPQSPAETSVPSVDIRPPPSEPRPAPRAEPEQASPRNVAILLSDDIPAFVSVADKLRRRLGPGSHTVHNLDGHPANSTRILDEIEGAEPDQIVAVGLLAATVGRRLEEVPLVFCYVFNYRDHDLISPSSKGVKMLPPFAMQIDAWMGIAPETRRIGVITGPNQEDLVDEIHQASEAAGMELSTRIVHSDQEALYVFKRLTPEIEGLWLLPDNRILSPRVVREIMSYAARHRIQVVVFGSGLLDLGAFMAITSLDGDIAEQVAARLADTTDNGWPAGPDMAPLTKMELEINADVAAHLGLIHAERSARSGEADR